MTIYYVGPGGNDANNGLSWANRKLTLNGAEDVPVAAGDTVYVGPGVYREGLVLDVDGSVGNIITYIADVTGRIQTALAASFASPEVTMIKPRRAQMRFRAWVGITGPFAVSSWIRSLLAPFPSLAARQISSWKIALGRAAPAVSPT